MPATQRYLSLERAWGLSGALALALLSWSCGVETRLVDGECEYTFECAAGEICRDGRCVSAREQIPGTGGAGGEAGSGGSGGEAGSGGSAGTGGEGGTGGTGGTGGAGPRVTFAPNDYRRCFDSLECAVFGGNCIVELPLSRPQADGTDRIKLSDLDPSLKKGQGICGVPCTNEPRICDSFVVTGPEGQSKPSVCQLVFEGESPYPEGAAVFPFPLDAQAMARGVPYASICRPPFEYAAAHSPEFCKPCTEAGQCADGDGCWLERPFAGVPSGSCVQACELQKDCPFGFRCTDLTSDDPLFVGATGSYCLPIAGTCGRCLDRDGDQRGVGTCGSLDEPFTEVDCDDANTDAYFDPRRTFHPFPRFCGEIDFNCNGLSDRAEQEGSDDHCAFCGDRCVGPVDHGQRLCMKTDDGHACAADCEPGFADCNGVVADGCETELQDGMIWSRDRDGDGRGNPKERRYFCDGSAPAGWVQNGFDCDDESASRFGGGVDGAGATIPASAEICDGIDNDCNGLVDDGTVVVLDAAGAVTAVAGEACDTGLLGVCAAGRYACEAAVAPEEGASLASMRCVPDRDPAVAMRSLETCNGLDDDCDGNVDDGVDWFADRGQTNPEGPGAPAICTVPGGKGICAFGVMQCQAAADGTADWGCVQNQPKAADPIGDGVDENCDGIDGELQTAVFVRPVAGGGTLNGNDANLGTAQAPVASIARALQLACAVPSGKSCRDIYVEEGGYSSAKQIDLPTSSAPGADPYVRIYGGFKATVSCDGACSLQWARPAGTRSTVVREAPAADPNRRINGETMPFGATYAAIGGAAGGPMELLLDRVDVEVVSPDPSYQMPDGASAPAQIGVQCPSQGCARLMFDDVAIVVDAGLNGALGAAGEGGKVAPQGNNGVNGCASGENCAAGSFLLYPWPGDFSFMNYGWCPASGTPTAASSDFRRDAATCADGRSPYGGSSGGVRCFKSVSSASGWVGGWGGGGNGAGWGGGGGSRGARGANGAIGRGGVYSNWVGALTWTGGPNNNWSYGAPTSGVSGGGGGGAGGCLRFPGWNPSYFGCDSNHRGGGGGAGGCNGTAGGRGGNGGSAIGLVLVPPSTGTLSLLTPGPFVVSVGKGGKGGNGGAGGTGAPGGWGGLGKANSDDISFAGGEGGDGGGGGGGGGGHGGQSVGIWRVCIRAGGSSANGCFMNLPPMMTASPDLFVSPGAAGQAGAGGAGGKRGQKPVHQAQREDTGARPSGPDEGRGADGKDGQRFYLYFSGGSL